MAKKSAKSKGFRKQNTKKPYLSKRDIVLLCLLVAAVAVGAFFLFRYDDGALKVQDGKVVADGDNWLIVNGAGTRGGTRYFKLGEMGEIDGYAREADSIATDVNIPQYVFSSEAGDAAVDTISVTTSHNSAAPLAKYGTSMLAELKGNEVGELQSGELSGRDAQYFFYTTSPVETDAAEETAETGEAEAEETAEAGTEEAAEDEAEETAAETEEADEAEAEEEAEEAAKPYRKSLNGYIDASHDSCIVIHIESGADDPEAFPADGDMIAALEQAIAAVTLEDAKK